MAGYGATKAATLTILCARGDEVVAHVERRDGVAREQRLQRERVEPPLALGRRQVDVLPMGGDVEMGRWGEVERWRGGEVERWRGGEVERWRGGE